MQPSPLGGGVNLFNPIFNFVDFTPSHCISGLKHSHIQRFPFAPVGPIGCRPIYIGPYTNLCVKISLEERPFNSDLIPGKNKKHKSNSVISSLGIPVWYVVIN